ncbi:rubredoxin [Methanocorpusculum sp. MG]|uniref:Rubredoxin n=1 Tax=Methanocorpusculum petauri TaxID=3002863 RepID=A0ABT4IGX9_9EURY|nr:rubredoxin [Methanocorpusculum petauri]MCZ0860992.1 rubredoxin [Methanocorpusculum petauri]
MAKYQCMTCGYMYDEEKGAAPEILAGTPFDKIPDTWVCPMCGASKKFFVKRG